MAPGARSGLHSPGVVKATDGARFRLLPCRPMALTRLGYLVILVILATAAAAILFVIWPFGSSDDGSKPSAIATATAPATIPLYPNLDFDRLIPFVQLGAVAGIEARADNTILVNFRPDFDTSGFGTPSHTFQSTVPQGRTVEGVLRDAGIPVNESGGVQVVRR
jgi:hypothetical protein